MESNGTLYVVDGSNFLFRAYHALPPLTTKAGLPVGAIYGFAQMLIRLELDYRPDHLAIVFDTKVKSFRSTLYAEYKANRPEPPDDLKPQFALVRRLVEAFSLPVIEATTAEADDVIATIAKQAEDQGLRVAIVSSDKDLMQLVDDNCVLVDTMKNLTYTAKQVEEKWGVPPVQLRDLLALMGDSIDNVPGVQGVGPKTAAALIQGFGSVEALFERLPELAASKTIRGAKGLAEKLTNHGADKAKLALQLVTLDTNVPDLPKLATLKRQPMEMGKLEPFLRELEFEKLLDRLRPQTKPQATAPTATASTASASTSATATAPATPTVPATPTPTLPTRILLDEIAITEFVDANRAAPRIAVRIAAVHQVSGRGTIIGIALATDSDSVYIPAGHRYLGAPAQLSPDRALVALAPLLTSGPAKVVHDLKTAQLWLDPFNLTLDPVENDPMLASFLLDPATDHEIAALALRFAGRTIRPLEAIIGKGKKAVELDSLEIETVGTLLGEEAQALLPVAAALGPLLAEHKQLGILQELELPLSRVLAKIERRGICLDVERMHQISRDFDTRLQSIEKEVHALAGAEINLGSPKQLADLLFDKLGLPVIRKTKTGLSTDAEVLEELAPLHPVPAKILEHRMLAKLKGTYVDSLPQLVDARTGRLHTSYKQTIAATGRLSSTEPNLQNVPIRTDEGKQIRAAFVAPEGKQLIALDYSQIELRVLAHLSGDPVLTDAFNRDEDIHRRTVREMFGAAREEEPDLRRVAKMINYGIVYGLSDFGLAQRLGIQRADAKTYIQGYLQTYAGVARYMEGLVDVARAEGGARTLLGRFRPIAELASPNRNVRMYGERIAKNTPIQGSAADLLKLAMIAVDKQLGDEFPDSTMLLTVHDELVIESPTADTEKVAAALTKTMEQVLSLKVPLKVDAGWGHSWADT